MAKYFRSMTLTEAGVEVLDCEHKTPKGIAEGFPYIAIPDIQEGRVVLETTRKIAESDLLEWTRRTTPQVDDIIITRRGRVGDSAPVPDGLRCAIGQNLVLLRSDNSSIDQKFLKWAVRSPQWWREVDRLTNVGAVFSSLNVRDIGKIRLDIPDRCTQGAIIEVLGALDDKIAANTKLIAAVDSLAEVQFYAALHDSQPQPLSSLASFVNGKAFTKGASGTGRVVVRIAELNSGIGKSTVFSDAEVDDKHVARPGDILFAWSGSLTLHRWFRDEAIVNQHIFKVTPDEGIADWLIYEFLRNKIVDFKMIAADKATTMGHIQRKHLDEPVLVPSEAAQRKIATLMESLWQTALTAERENLTLATTRDALLPHLMSGKLRVKDAEKVLENAL